MIDEVEIQTTCSIQERYDLELRSPVANEHDYCDIPNTVNISDYKVAAITYISGVLFFWIAPSYTFT